MSVALCLHQKLLPAPGTGWLHVQGINLQCISRVTPSLSYNVSKGLSTLQRNLWGSGYVLPSFKPSTQTRLILATGISMEKNVPSTLARGQDYGTFSLLMMCQSPAR